MAGTVDDRLVEQAAAGLREGGRTFTARQLYYAVCALLPGPRVTATTGRIAAGALLLVLGAVFTALTSVYLLFVIVLGAILLGFGLQARRAERDRPSVGPPPLSWNAFLTDVLAPRRGRLGGLLGEAAPADTPAPAAGATLVVCDRPDTAALLRDNAGAAGLQVDVVPEADAAALVGGRRVLALHDASRDGCALPLRLLRAGAAEVVDVGLRPTQVMHRGVRVVPVTPAVVDDAELLSLLLPDDIVWLADGRCVDLAVLPTGEVLEAVRRAAATRAGGAGAPRVSVAASAFAERSAAG